MSDPRPVAGSNSGKGAHVPTAGQETTEQIKGSAVLMSGRVIEVLANMVVQVLVVRYLSKGDYGAFAYALSFVATIRILVTLGHGRTITRFFAIYEERRQYDKLFGAILMEFSIIGAMGLTSFLGAWAFQGWLGATLAQDPYVVSVLLVVLVLAPFEALDEIMEGLFAVFARPKAVFLRRYVLSPALKLCVVVTLVVSGRGIMFLALGYVIVSAIGLAVYIPAMLRVLRHRGILEHFHWRSAKMPVKEVFNFSIPLLSAEFVLISIDTISVMILGFYRGTGAVAAFRAIRPAATLNSFVMRSFNLLFLPLASRLYARSDEAGMREAYWRTAAWIAVLTFPMFAVTFVFAEAMTVMLFGERYRDSAVYLTILSVGYYLNAAFGFNSTILQVAGRLRYLVVVNTTAAVTNIALCLLLVPAHGPLGVALSGSIAMVLQNVSNQFGLRHVGVGFFPRTHVRVYGSIVMAISVLWVLERMLRPGIIGSVMLAGLGAAAVFVVNRHLLSIIDMYPGLATVPLVRRFLGEPSEESVPPTNRGRGA